MGLDKAQETFSENKRKGRWEMGFFQNKQCWEDGICLYIHDFGWGVKNGCFFQQ